LRAPGIVPDGHVGAGDDRELDGTRETLITHGIIVLQADLELDSLQKVALLLIERVVKKLFDVATNSGCRKLSEFEIFGGAEFVGAAATYRL
jgi:hypothetical protein